MDSALIRGCCKLENIVRSLMVIFRKEEMLTWGTSPDQILNLFEIKIECVDFILLYLVYLFEFVITYRGVW